MALDDGDSLAAVCVATNGLTLLASTRGGKAVEFAVSPKDWEPWLGKRAKG